MKAKLFFEFLPEEIHEPSLRELLINSGKRKEWNIIRKKVYEKDGCACSVCGAKGRLDCHEIWEYENKKHIQKLVGFTSLCFLCHMIKHVNNLLRPLEVCPGGRIPSRNLVKKISELSSASSVKYFSLGVGRWGRLYIHRHPFDKSETINLERIIEHFKKVNSCSEKTFLKCLKKACILNIKRDQQSISFWKADYSGYDKGLVIT